MISGKKLAKLARVCVALFVISVATLVGCESEASQ